MLPLSLRQVPVSFLLEEYPHMYSNIHVRTDSVLITSQDLFYKCKMWMDRLSVLESNHTMLKLIIVKL